MAISILALRTALITDCKIRILEFECQLRRIGTNEIDEPAKPTRPLSYLAKEAETDWSRRGQGVSPYARPYLTAMGTLSTMEDRHGADIAMEAVMYFLNNARGWRGEVAKRIKKELNARIKLWRGHPVTHANLLRVIREHETAGEPSSFRIIN